MDDELGLFPRSAVGIAALICGILLVVMAVLGPLGLDLIEHRVSQSAKWQLEGQDIADLLFLAPLLFIGGLMAILNRPNAKYLLILAPLTLMYTGLSIGVGAEWSDPTMTGNVEDFTWIFLGLVVGGLFLLISTLSMFGPDDIPDLEMKGLRKFSIGMSLFLFLFAWMWIFQVITVVHKGDLPDGSYADGPTLFWTIRYLDLGIVVPLGFMALYLLQKHPKRAYSLVLLFFGFFATMAISVDSMLAVQVIKGDQNLGSIGPGAGIFLVLTALTFYALYYLLRHRLRPSPTYGRT
ncbi:MAG: hypothetical protein HPY73_07325 [Methanomassiliicoccales archaeon]|nr:MAG: hypothetical protein HPY73_07325 [Methanomassiliicoccales archaeon]